MDKALSQIRKDTRSKAGFVIAFFIMIACYVISMYNNRRIEGQAKIVDHTNQVILNLERLMLSVRNAEAGTRGYILTRNTAFLSPYFGARNDADSLFAELQSLLSDNPVQVKRLNRLNTPLQHRFDLLELAIQNFENNNRSISDSMLSRQQDAGNTMQVVQSTIEQIEAEEMHLLKERDRKLKTTFSILNTITYASLAVAFILVIFGVRTYLSEYKARQQAGDRIKGFQEELKNRINELDKANKELIRMRSQEKFAATGRIARTIAHEVRNPLTNINLAADQLKGELPVSDENTAYLFDIISRNSKRINQLIADLLQSTKFTDLNFEKVSVNDLLDEALKDANDRIRLAGVEVVKKFSNDLCTVSVDTNRMKIAFLNIIINAVEAMENRTEKKLTIETSADEGKCRVVISDTGPGMDNETVNKLFEPYFTSKPKGNGLGLTNTQNIILNHKGDISVLSRQGEGTTFNILLDFSGQ
ncbi:MAG: CHASE3 domain-containing protein [Chitinophagaceae bacterium]